MLGTVKDWRDSSQHSCSTNADPVSSPIGDMSRAAARLDARAAGRVTRSPAARRSCAMLVPACTPTWSLGLGLGFGLGLGLGLGLGVRVRVRVGVRVRVWLRVG